MELDTRYCPICDTDTEQMCQNSTHERDSTADYQKCLQCEYEYSGYTGKWEEVK